MCNTRKKTTSAIAVIIAEQLGHSDTLKQELVTTFQSYFGVAQVDNDKQLTMLDDVNWSEDELKASEHNILTNPVIICLKKVVVYTREVMKKSLHLRPNATYEDFDTSVAKALERETDNH